MTGFSSIPLAEEGGEREGAHLAGVAKILGPRWAQLPAITIGLLGVQVFWSVEMSYGPSTILSSARPTDHGYTLQARRTYSPSGSPRPPSLSSSSPVPYPASSCSH